ncbi:hypothetical protein [Enterovibrio nigricans]|uniref:Uncharacterized protein n=1 Tax=Enterovibrio nigricans DSM 22720 TaxID=1121868 RepID=A0A1T4VT01_9GAMM|nr:hypothetical protein [Enterovibrio nigricans]PKF49126.1 hypothetical protein AT251_21235 [Enterovibrio nigricans]SKA68067.1 hypothetical protein SAMN02745132_04262 [Enterovibrio nigricans DSM 22720]
MDVIINNETALTLSSENTPEEEAASIVESVQKLRRCSLDPISVITECLESDKPNAKHQALSLITALAFEQRILTHADLSESVSLFWNPVTQDIIKFNPNEEIVISLHRSMGNPISANYTANEFITFALQAMEMTSHNFVAEDLPDSAVLFHAIGILAKTNGCALNTQIMKNSINIVMSEMFPVLIDELSQPVFIEEHLQSTH